MAEYWNVKSKEEYKLILEDPEGWFRVKLKWDGCAELYKFFNVPCTKRDDEEHPQLIDQIHICDLDKFIERLKELQTIAKKWSIYEGT